MANYRFGQFRESQLSTYLTPLTYTFDEIQIESELSKGVIFLDNAIELSGSNQLQGQDLKGKTRSYYLRFKIYKQAERQIFDVNLVNTELMQNNLQTISTIQVPAGDETDYSVFEFIITPNENRVFNRIHFELQREFEDYNSKNSKGFYGRLVKMEVERLQEVYNVINTLNPAINNLGTLKQIGVQSAPGLMMCINGEQIRVGRSGLYEIKNGIQVTFIGFIVENDDKYFILDYQY